MTRNLLLCVRLGMSCGNHAEPDVIFKEPPRTYVGYTAEELQFTRNTADCIAAPRRNFEADSAAQCYASHVMLVLLYGYQHEFFFHGLYGYENKEFFHGTINTQIILKSPDKLIRKRAPTTAVPRRTSAIQQQSCSSQEIQRIASLHVAETLRPTALPSAMRLT